MKRGSAISTKGDLDLRDQVLIQNQSDATNDQEIEAQKEISANLQSLGARMSKLGWGGGVAIPSDTAMHILTTRKIQHSPNDEDEVGAIQALSTTVYLAMDTAVSVLEAETFLVLRSKMLRKLKIQTNEGVF